MAYTVSKVEKLAQKKKFLKLQKALSSDNLEVRIATIKALGTTNDENVMYKLIPYLKDSEPSIRAAAAEALGEMGNGRSQEFVRQMLNSESDVNVLEKAKLAMEKIRVNVAKSEKH